MIEEEKKGEKKIEEKKKKVVMEGKDIRVWLKIKKGLMRRKVENVKEVEGINVNMREGKKIGVVGEQG